MRTLEHVDIAVAAELGALAAWMVFSAGDRVGGLVFNDSRIDSIAPLRSRKRVEALCSRIAEQNRSIEAQIEQGEAQRSTSIVPEILEIGALVGAEG